MRLNVEVEVFSFRMRINKYVVKIREVLENICLSAKQPLSNFPMTFKAFFKQLS